MKALVPNPVRGRLGGYGRGLLAGAWVFWPTRDGKIPSGLSASSTERK